MEVIIDRLIEMYNTPWEVWAWVIGIFVTVLVLLALLSPRDSNRQCAWCNGFKIKFKDGKEGSWYWEFRNKDGSRDKRVKGNFQKASYTSEFVCDECSATTQFIHFVSKKPSADVKVWKRILVNKGSNERKGKDWIDKKAQIVDKNSANRKNN